MLTKQEIRNGIDSVATFYDAARPDYPSETVAWFFDQLGVRSGRKVLDIYCGTGRKLTTKLLLTGADVEAVEPGPRMRMELAAVCPEVTVYDADAEALPLSDSSVDIVTVSQSFQWFETQQVLTEIHRVLRPGGSLGVLYTRRCHTDPAQKGLAKILNSAMGTQGKFDWSEGRWRGILAGSPMFSAGNQSSTRFIFDCDEEQFVLHARSIGFVAAAGSDVQTQVEQDARAFVKSKGGIVRLAYEAVAIATFRVPGAALDSRSS